MNKFLLLITFTLGSFIVLILSVALLFPSKSQNKPMVLAATVPLLNSKDQDESTMTVSFETTDARPVVVKNYLRKYGSPLEPFARQAVEISDKYHLDWRLLIAIAQQESNLCKKIPVNSYNCWGFGIYGNLVTRFDSYTIAMETVAKTLKKNYIDRGLVTPEEIMVKYTPPSKGSWARGVNQFLAELE